MEITAQPNNREGIECLGTVDWKDAWFDFEDVINKQFKHGGTKYAFDDKSEWTDVLTGMAPAWLAATVSKYCGRLKVFGRERDLIKILRMRLSAGFRTDAITKTSLARSLIQQQLQSSLNIL